MIGCDIQQAAGTILLYAGQEAGSEAAIHEICQIFNKHNPEGVLLVDASNAFNQLNHEMTFQNVQALCPPIAIVLINTYCDNAELFVDGYEGTTQGDPLPCPSMHLQPSHSSRYAKSMSYLMKRVLLIIPLYEEAYRHSIDGGTSSQLMVSGFATTPMTARHG